MCSTSYYIKIINSSLNYTYLFDFFELSTSMSNFSKYFRKIMISVWGPIFPQKTHVTWVTNKTNEHLRFPSLYPSGYLVIDITSISGANLLKRLYCMCN